MEVYHLVPTQDIVNNKKFTFWCICCIDIEAFENQYMQRINDNTAPIL